MSRRRARERAGGRPLDADIRMPRRRMLCLPVLCALPGGSAQAQARDRAWIEAAEEMRRLALSWGDQPYGAVLVRDDRIIGYGPSRVVKNGDPDAHAEREAIRHAISQAGPQDVKGSVLYSTSRPCAACEAAAARAGIMRMYVGPQGQDAGAPRGG